MPALNCAQAAVEHKPPSSSANSRRQAPREIVVYPCCMANTSLAGVEQKYPHRSKNSSEGERFHNWDPSKAVWRSKGKAVPPASNPYPVRIKSCHLRTPRPFAVASQVCIYDPSFSCPPSPGSHALVLWSLTFVADERETSRRRRLASLNSVAGFNSQRSYESS